MTPEQEQHLEEIHIEATQDIDSKYRKGQQEHGGDIWNKGLVSLIAKEIRHEAIDLMVYTHDLTNGLMEIQEHVEDLINIPTLSDEGKQARYQRMLDILKGTVHTD